MTIIEFNKNNFSGNKLLPPYNGSNTSVVILWKAEWCGHCKNFKDTYAELAKRFKGKITFATVDADDSGELINVVNNFLNGYKILGYPSITLYQGGYFLEMYEHSRDLEIMSDYLKKIYLN